MYTLFYIVVAVFITFRISKLYFSFKFKHDVKFIESVVRNVLYVVQNEKVKIKKKVGGMK